MTESEGERCEDALHAATKGDPKWWGSMPGIWRDQFEDGWRKSWAAATAPRPAPEGTVRVRVPVVTMAGGAWNAYGKSRHDDRTNEANALASFVELDFTRSPRLVTIITADVPLPSPPVEVNGEVEA